MYYEPLFRPPAEGNSLIVQATIGCSFNTCRFCAMYKNKKFSALSETDLARHLKELQGYYPPSMKRAFIADGDALVLPPEKIIKIMSQVKEAFPSIKRFGIYGSVYSLRDKTVKQLRELKKAGLTFVYFGIESGDPDVLKKMKKYTPVEQMTAAGQRVIEAGLKLSVMVILGLGGLSGSDSHIKKSAEVINAMSPTYTSVLNLMFQGNDLAKNPDYNNFSRKDYRRELSQLISLVNCKTIFRSNHASNYLPLKGTLPRDREKLLRTIEI